MLFITYRFFSICIKGANNYGACYIQYIVNAVLFFLSLSLHYEWNQNNDSIRFKKHMYFHGVNSISIQVS